MRRATIETATQKKQVIEEATSWMTQNKTSRLTQFLSLILILTCMLLNIPSYAKTIDFCSIKFTVINNHNNNKHYIWLHGNEQTARRVLLNHINKNPGKVFLIQSNQRLIRINGYALDPNRIFPNTGVRETLKKYNPHIKDEKINKIVGLIQQQRDIFLKKILPPQKGILIALHNNQLNYSILHEKKNSLKTSIKRNQSPHNFFLCTSEKDFNILKNSQYNVALQNHIKAIDDGSLSQLMARKKRRYINIETRLGAKEIQTSMLNYVEQHIRS
jgi:hypothetical protein